jgi:hypothetical protein
VDEISVYRSEHICLSVHMFQLQNLWMDFHRTLYNHFAVGAYPNLTDSFPIISNKNMADA